MTNNRSNVMIYLIGPPGVGKYTVGLRLSEILPAKLVDNHHWLNPVFSLIKQDGKTPLPRGVWEQVAQVRKAVFRTMATLSPNDWNFVLTHASTGSALDHEIAGDILEAACLRKADLLTVRLTCSADQLAARVVSPDRRLRMKETNPDAARLNAIKPLFDPGQANTITINTTGLSAEETAARIIQRLI
jgi:shikimate kinase